MNQNIILIAALALLLIILFTRNCKESYRRIEISPCVQRCTQYGHDTNSCKRFCSNRWNDIVSYYRGCMSYCPSPQCQQICKQGVVGMLSLPPAN